jgi:hypothetical protein
MYSICVQKVEQMIMTMKTFSTRNKAKHTKQGANIQILDKVKPLQYNMIYLGLTHAYDSRSEAVYVQSVWGRRQ